MKYFKRLDVYKNSTGSNKFYPSENKAYSYGWWLYYTVIDGVSIFNNSTYSASTSKHQSALFSILDYKADIIIRDSNISLTDISGIKADLRYKAKILVKELRNPRGRGQAKIRRQQRLNDIIKTYSKLTKLKAV